jgi:5'-methylthioadenosine phosphorylase
MEAEAEIGIIGGSGFYSLLENADARDIDTEYGKPSSKVSVGKIGNKTVAFIARHGSKHTIPPHMVPYRANIEAFSILGVKRVIATNAVGSLNPEFRVGEIAIFDQFANMTHGRKDTFFDKDQVAHISVADPYCEQLRHIAYEAAQKLGIPSKYHGSVVVINGPRFSTKAESRSFIKQGFDMINMTQYPEVALAREKEMCYCGIGIVTDYDAGVLENTSVKPVTHAEVMKAFSKNVENVKNLISEIVAKTPKERSCSCGNALESAMVKA